MLQKCWARTEFFLRVKARCNCASAPRLITKPYLYNIELNILLAKFHYRQ